MPSNSDEFYHHSEIILLLFYFRAPAGTSVNFFSKHKRSLRPTLTPGRVCIVLAGAHKGKRVVVLKQLASGLVLINGPLKLNGYPMRRVNQNYLLATGTSVDVSAVNVPENVNDDYFRHAKPEKVKRKTEMFFLITR